MLRLSAHLPSIPEDSRYLPLQMHTDICRNRHGGNPESDAAFRAIAGHIAAQSAEVAALIAAVPVGLTCEQAEEMLGSNRSSVSARFSELKKAGLIGLKRIGIDERGEIIYERRKTRSGASAAVLIWNGHPVLDLDSKRDAF